MSKKKKDATFDWHYSKVGGTTRVNIVSGEDLVHLGELDQKKWTVLSCPTKGLEFDAETLGLIDTDGDGKIRINEVVNASKWITSVIKDKDLILKGEDTLNVEMIDTGNEEGQKLAESAKRILRNLGKEETVISLADTADTKAIFSGTPFNGDGVVTALSTEDEGLRKLMENIESTYGAETDRCGEPGVNAEKVEKFYAACADYDAWMKAMQADKSNVMPFGDGTAAAFAACEAVKEKVAAFFMNCRVMKFDDSVYTALNVAADNIDAYPIAMPNKECKLDFGKINPAWEAKVLAFRNFAFADKESVNEEEWNAAVAKFGPYTAWMGEKKGAEVEPLGADAVAAVLKEDRKAELLSLVEKDNEEKENADNILNVRKLMLLYKNFGRLINNFVTFKEFYSLDKEEKAVFQSGKLYIDERCCELCIRVDNMGGHANMAGLSGMFLIYCTCTSKVKNATMDIVAVLTDGEISDLRPGKNGVFYDMDGQDWDAVITNVVDNPINLRQAFWSPYRKVGRFISDKMSKSIADKESKSLSNLQGAVDNAAPVEGAGAAKPAKAQPFDIAKFCGIFAAIGMALGYIGAFFVSLGKGIMLLEWWQLLLAIVALVLVISGPSCIIAYCKLRKRNLGPVLNANGWAINSKVLVNIIFGKTLTSVAKYPVVKMKDPFAKKGMPCWAKWLIAIVIIAAAAFAVLYFTGNLAGIGLPR